MKKSNLTTLCYIERGDEYLMLHRVKKKNDVNHDKWIGVGGHFEDGESPEECLLREVLEETGLTLTKWRFCGIVTFCFTPDETPVEKAAAAPAEANTSAEINVHAAPAVTPADSTGVQPSICEYMHLYTASAYEGELIPCGEGELVWIKKDELEQLPIWEGDRIFLRLLRERDSFFSLKLSYLGDRLTEAVLDGRRLQLSK
ncbi:MAG: 8-oxo-dGTP diphosphatase [bacterium]|nr:8-oxo-dGTP diphosphatase [bacterium]